MTFLSDRCAYKNISHYVSCPVCVLVKVTSVPICVQSVCVVPIFSPIGLRGTYFSPIGVRVSMASITFSSMT